jgi:restriction endonuclease Mrr
MQLPKFEEYGECERCRKTAALTSNGICQSCLEYLIVVREDPFSRAKELRRIAQSENGVIQFATRILRGRSSQTTPERMSALERKALAEERRELSRLIKIIEAPPSELTKRRARAPYIPEILEVADELLTRLREYPELLYQIDPRKFEEVIAELMSRIGFLDVRLTSKIKDKGRDVIAKLAVPTGLLHVIAECKRFAPGNPVGLAIIERFLFTIRDERAAFGLIATTSYFSKGAIAKAQEYASTLHLAEFERISGWLTGGVWHASANGRIWIPPVV